MARSSTSTTTTTTTKGSRWIVVAMLVCGCGPTGGGRGGRDVGLGGDGRGGDAAARDGGPRGDAPSLAKLVSISVLPATATLTSTNGSAPSQTFVATGHYSDGSSRLLTGVTWTLDNAVLGMLSPSGSFTAGGQAGGTATVMAAVGSGAAAIRGTASLTVQLVETDTAMASAGAPAMFAGSAAAATDLSIDYPLDGAYLPNNLPSIDVQWENAMPGDVYDVRVTGPYVTFDGYAAVPSSGTFKDDYMPPLSAFLALEDSTDGKTPYVLTVLRSRAGAAPQLVQSAPVHLTITLGRVAGRVYYWNLGAGQIDVIAQGSATHATLGYAPPAGGGASCIACHTVSRDGKSLAAEFYSGFTGPSGLLDLSATPVAARVPPWPGTFNSISSSFSPDGSRLVGVSDAPISQPRLELMSAADGSSVMMTLPAFDAAYPEWSPDGKTVAFAGDETSSWPNGLYYQGADLFTIPVAPSGLFGGASLVVARDFDGSTAENSIYAPTFSPDSAFLVFGRGAYSDSCGPDCLPGQNPPPTDGNLYVVPAAGGAAPAALASIGAAGENYLPRFSPFVQGGYFWLAYFSRRDYGNALAGTKGAANGSGQLVHRRQIWIAAVDPAAPAGTDPSHAPYWLPGQDVTTDNMSAYWAPAPCVGQGGGCAASVDCCAGLFCRAPSSSGAGGGAPVCVPPTMAGCSMLDEACSSSADCCAGMGLTCVAHVCSPLG